MRDGAGEARPVAWFCLSCQVKGEGEMERGNSCPPILTSVQSLLGECLGEKVPVSPRRSVSKGQLHLLFLISSFLLQQIPLKLAGL